VDKSEVEVDPFTELRARRIGLQEFTQALWLCARESKTEAERVLSRLDELAESGILEGAKYQELKSMTYSLIENAQVRPQQLADHNARAAQTAIERQKAKFLEELGKNQSKVLPQQGLCVEEDAPKSSVTGPGSDVGKDILPTDEARDVEPSALAQSADENSSPSARKDCEVSAQEPLLISCTGASSDDTDLPPVQALKPAADAENQHAWSETPPAAKTAVKAQVDAGASVHVPAVTDSSIETVRLNTGEHLDFEGTESFQLDDSMDFTREDRVTLSGPVAESVSSKAWMIGVVALAGSALIAWYVSQQGWVNLQSQILPTIQRLSEIELFRDADVTTAGGSQRSSDSAVDNTQPQSIPAMAINREGNAIESAVPSDEEGDLLGLVESDEASQDARAGSAEAAHDGLNVDSSGGSVSGEAASQTLYQQLVKACRDGELEPASQPGTALYLLQALEAGGASALRVQRAKARVAQAYLSQARLARQAKDWAQAELSVSKAVRLRQTSP